MILAWDAFVSEMPTPAACVTAGRAQVVRRWEGLGYHRRAVALHGAASAIVERHAGEVPDALDALVALPGVGPYTARAVLAFAFERDVGVVDTNVARILSRAVAGRPLGARESQGLADRLVTPGRGWAHNQAMLDFGALTCSARPDCGGCALRRSCAWARAGYPSPDPAAATAGTSRPQPRFKGSDRELRGRILSLARAARPGAGWRDELEAEFSDERVDAALRALEREGLIAARGRRLALA